MTAKRRKPVLVTKPVEAFVGPIEVRLMPYESYRTAVDDYDKRPWAWLAMCRVKLRIDGLTCTKKLTGKYTYGSVVRPQLDRPDDTAIRDGLSSVVEQVKHGLARLGIDGVEPEVIVHEGRPTDGFEVIA